jgi:hypothetical protein
MAEYFISGVWFSTSGTSKRITHVMLHEVENIMKLTHLLSSKLTQA